MFAHFFSTIRRVCCRPAGLEEARNENCTLFLGYRITELPHHDLFVLFCFNLLGPTTQRIKTLGSNRKLKLTGERVGYLKCTTQPNCCEKGVVLSFQTLLSKITHSTTTANEYSASKCGLLNRVLLASAREDLLGAGLGGKHYRPS